MSISALLPLEITAPTIEYGLLAPVLGALGFLGLRAFRVAGGPREWGVRLAGGGAPTTAGPG